VNGPAGSIQAPCPPGQHPLGGGYKLNSEHLTVRASYPDATGWVIEVANDDAPNSYSGTVYVVCATVA
jgi:hypothetical protein